MDLLLRYLWIGFVVATCVNGHAWWNGVQQRIRSNPELEPGYRGLYRGYLFWVNLPWVVMGLGIISGRVPSIFEFLRPNEGKAFVLGWWGLMASLLCLGTYWVLAGGGAEMLERHPGVYMVPQWTASKRRLFWLGVVAWNVAVGTLFFLGFPRGPHAGGSWMWAFFPVFFVGMWALVSVLLSAMGGWRALAQHYVATTRFSGKRFRFRSAQLGGYVNYGSCLTLGADASGLYLAVLPLFRVAHPPLIIPWSDVRAREATSWLFPVVELEFTKTPGVSMRVSRRLARSLFHAAGVQNPMQPAA